MDWNVSCIFCCVCDLTFLDVWLKEILASLFEYFMRNVCLESEELVLVVLLFHFQEFHLWDIWILRYEFLLKQSLFFFLSNRTKREYLFWMCWPSTVKVSFFSLFQLIFPKYLFLPYKLKLLWSSISTYHRLLCNDWWKVFGYAHNWAGWRI